MKLRSELEDKRMITLGKKVKLAMKLIRYLYTKPIADASEVTKVLAVNISKANRLIQDFEKLGILSEKTGFKRNRIFVFKKYLNLFER